MTGNEEYALEVSKMTISQLLREIIDNPNYLTDHYYIELGDPLQKRAEELLREHKE